MYVVASSLFAMFIPFKLRYGGTENCGGQAQHGKALQMLLINRV